MNWLRKILGGAAAASRIDAKPDVAPEAVPANAAPQDRSELDVFGIVVEVLASAGHSLERREDHLLHASSGIRLVPQLLESQAMKSGHVRSSSRIGLRHPAFGAGIVTEYQHSIGDTLEHAFRAAVLGWAEVDFVVLLDALLPKARHSKVMLMTFPSNGEAGERRRRILLGPVSHLRHFKPDPEAESPALDPGEHEFCPCCLLTKNYDAFQNLFNDGEFHAIRLFACRDENGALSADCRVNGEDFGQGKESLHRYAGSWPQHGFEYRKQYVVIQDYTPASMQVSG